MRSSVWSVSSMFCRSSHSNYVRLERESVWTFLKQSAGVLSEGDIGFLKSDSPILAKLYVF